MLARCVSLQKKTNRLITFGSDAVLHTCTRGNILASRLNYMHCQRKANRHPRKTTAGTTHPHPGPRSPPPTPRQPRPNQDTTPQSTKAELEPGPQPTAKPARLPAPHPNPSWLRRGCPRRTASEEWHALTPSAGSRRCAVPFSGRRPLGPPAENQRRP